MTLKLAQFCDENLHTPKNIEIQNFEPKKMVLAYVYVKISEYPPGDPTLNAWQLCNV